MFNSILNVMGDFLFYFVIFIVIIMIFGAIVSSSGKTVDPSETESESYSRKNEPSYNAAKTQTTAEDLRVNTDESIKLPALTAEQRQRLKSAVNYWNPVHDSQQAVVVEVVGAYYRSESGKVTYANCKIGDKVVLKLDPDNEYDDTAVKVMAKRSHIGYVPMQFSNVIYGKLWCEDFDDSYVIEPTKSDDLSGLKIAIFIKK